MGPLHPLYEQEKKKEQTYEQLELPLYEEYFYIPKQEPKDEENIIIIQAF